MLVLILCCNEPVPSWGSAGLLLLVSNHSLNTGLVYRRPVQQRSHGDCCLRCWPDLAAECDGGLPHETYLISHVYQKWSIYSDSQKWQKLLRLTAQIKSLFWTIVWSNLTLEAKSGCLANTVCTWQTLFLFLIFRWYCVINTKIRHCGTAFEHWRRWLCLNWAAELPHYPTATMIMGGQKQQCAKLLLFRCKDGNICISVLRWIVV